MSQTQKTNWGQFIPLVTVFFFWGFVAASNDILIPVFKKAFDLKEKQAMIDNFTMLSEEDKKEVVENTTQ